MEVDTTVESVEATLELLEPIIAGLSDHVREAVVTWMYRNWNVRMENHE